MKKFSKILVIVVIIFALVLMFYSIYNLHDEYRQKVEAESQKDFKPDFIQPEDEDENTNNAGNKKLPLMDFSGLMAQNSDVAAWISIENTGIDYPILQASDNDYYLRRTIELKYNNSGSIFMDYRSNADFKDFLSIIYGHHSYKGIMFTELDNFKDKSYFDSHSIGYLYTPNATYCLEIVAHAITESMSDFYKYSFASQSEKQAYLDMVEENATYLKKDQIFSINDHFVLLSTCSQQYDTARTVILARLILMS